MLAFVAVSQQDFLQAFVFSVLATDALSAQTPSGQHLEQSLQLSMQPFTQHFAQSTQQHEWSAFFAGVSFADTKPTAPKRSAITRRITLVFIIVFLKVLKNGFVLYGFAYHISPLIPSKGIRHS